MSKKSDEIKKNIQQKLESLNFKFDDEGNLVFQQPDKEHVKQLHAPSRNLELESSQKWIQYAAKKHQHFFANGLDIKPQDIKPELILVTEKWQNELFRLARYTWSLPYSQGFGRRIRYLILDQNNGKLLGIFALQSPPIGFPARDKLFEYPENKKTELVNQTMDIHTLGAIPPYGRLLGSKLVALACVSNEVRKDYTSKYEAVITKMEERILPSHLVALTTTSAFGKSSIYNRLKYNNQVIAQSIGYTQGFGSFHLMSLYPLFKQYLQELEIDVAGGYGTGPRRKWQIMRTAMKHIGLQGDLLKHGVKREAFLFPLISNLQNYMEGKDKKPKYLDMPFADLADYWRSRWLIPRSSRVNGWHEWENQLLIESLLIDKTQSNSK